MFLLYAAVYARVVAIGADYWDAPPFSLLAIPAMTNVITLTRAHLGRTASDQPSSLESHPGRVVPRRPSAWSVAWATDSGVRA
jgi:hypothetical protein